MAYFQGPMLVSVSVTPFKLNWRPSNRSTHFPQLSMWTRPVEPQLKLLTISVFSNVTNVETHPSSFFCNMGWWWLMISYSNKALFLGGRRGIWGFMGPLDLYFWEKKTCASTTTPPRLMAVPLDPLTNPNDHERIEVWGSLYLLSEKWIIESYKVKCIYIYILHMFHMYIYIYATPPQRSTFFEVLLVFTRF